jgi:hypothetical protein
MKIFINNEIWNEKVNFVDENNVLLGYSMSQNCCEDADWFIDDKPWMTRTPDNRQDYQKTEGYDGWVFDTTYYQLIEDKEDIFDCGGMAIFKITKDGKEKFIHIFNHHNGYYSHGFEFKAGEEALKDWRL